jgi:lipoprotein-anchoring transpeptidase ErfK/SrfK
MNLALIPRERAAHRVLCANPLLSQKFHRSNVKGGARDSIALRSSRAEPRGGGCVDYAEHRYDAHHRTGQAMANESAANRRRPLRTTSALMLAGALLVAPAMFSSTASAQVLSYAPSPPSSLPSDNMRLAPVEPALTDRGDGSSSALSERMRRSVVALNTREAPGTVIIDTGNTALYYVLGQNRAIRYGVGVGREGFTWAGTQTITRKAEWPDWHPPAQMIARQPYLPRFMAGGPGNPLGARAMYLGSSEYRIHGTNDPSTIGKFVSSGCIRLTNEDVADLFSRVEVGTRVVVLAKNAPHLEASAAPNVRPASAAPRPVATTPAAGRQAMNLSMPSSH